MAISGDARTQDNEEIGKEDAGLLSIFGLEKDEGS